MENKVDIRWDSRYSDTMEDDKSGRWARVAYAGKFDNMGFWRGKICRWEIAWVKKTHIDDKLRFSVNYFFPSNSKYVFDDLKTAQKEVEKSFKWFIKMCTEK